MFVSVCGCGGDQPPSPDLISRSIFHVLPFEGQLHLWLQSHICLTLDDGGSTPSPDPFPVLFTSILFALHLHNLSILFYFSSAILIALNDNLELTVLCRFRDFFKDEIQIYVFLLTIIGQLLFHMYARFM